MKVGDYYLLRSGKIIKIVFIDESDKLYIKQLNCIKNELKYSEIHNIYYTHTIIMIQTLEKIIVKKLTEEEGVINEI